jgi:hypothetical protein
MLKGLIPHNSNVCTDLTGIANLSDDALFDCSSLAPTSFAIIHKWLVSSELRSANRFTSHLGDMTCTKEIQEGYKRPRNTKWEKKI